MLKKIDLSVEKTIGELKEGILTQTHALDIELIAQHATDQINQAIYEKDLPKLLAHYDNKGLIAIAASNLKQCHVDAFKSWLTRILRNNKAPAISKAIPVSYTHLTLPTIYSV